MIKVVVSGSQGPKPIKNVPKSSVYLITFTYLSLRIVVSPGGAIDNWNGVLK